MSEIIVRKIISETPLLINDDFGNKIDTGCKELLCYIGKSKKPETLIANIKEYKSIKENGYFIVND